MKKDDDVEIDYGSNYYKFLNKFYIYFGCVAR